MKNVSRCLNYFVLAFGLFASAGFGQTTSFTYQGRLTDSMMAANGTYDFQFSLFDFGGAQIGSTQTISNVTVTNGIFTVELDFGPLAFPGAERFLEIGVKNPAEPDYTTLSPRQRMTSAPYSVKSLNSATAENALQLGGVGASEFIQNGDIRLSDDRDPNPGSEHYIHNTASKQPASNFNISGIGTATLFNSSTQYNINGARVLGAPAGTQNTFAGIGAGLSAGVGNFNSFYGFNAGQMNTTGSGNSFFGTDAGRLTSIGATNSFFGRSAGLSNSAGGGNSFFGVSSGRNNTTGNSNTFLGAVTGLTNTTGNNITLVGWGTDVGSNELMFAAAIGAGSVVNTSNTIVLGRSAGTDTVEIPGTGKANIFDATTHYNFRNSRILGVGGELVGNFTSLFVGLDAGATSSNGISNTFVGRNAGFANTDGDFNSFLGYNAGSGNTTGINNSFLGYLAGTANTIGNDNSFFGWLSGSSNTDGPGNSFFGSESGRSNTTGQRNSFYGNLAGSANTTGSLNSFFGHAAGILNQTGSYNTFLGHITGQTPRNSTRVTLLGAFSDAADNLDFATAIGAHAVVSTSNTIVLGRSNGADKVVVPGLGEGGDLQLCWNVDLQIARCVSSLRFKTNVQPFTSGLNLVNRLQPITFDWTTNGRNDLGLGAEDVAKIEPLLVTYNNDGSVEGVKYDRIGVVLLNAVKEQQAEIERQQRQIDEQRALIDGLRELVCGQNPQAQVCRSDGETRDEN
jgi:hypothetical protein